MLEKMPARRVEIAVRRKDASVQFPLNQDAKIGVMSKDHSFTVGCVTRHVWKVGLRKPEWLDLF